MPVTVATARRRSLPTWAYRTGSLSLYFLLTCFLYGFDVFNNSKILLQSASDQAQEVWFLAWPAYAITHVVNPFQTDWMNHPYGVNMITNTSMPLLGFIGAPITWIFGPVVTYTLLMRLAMVLSAASMQFVARRIGISRTGALVAGLIFGFSTFQIANGYGHLFLEFCALPPLIFYSVYCLVIGRWRPRRSGVTIGALFAADFLISAERSLMTAIVLVVVAIVAVIFAARLITKDVILRVAEAALWGAGVAVAILIVPILAMQGHGHVVGKAHVWIQSYETDFYAPFLPTSYTWFHPISFHYAFGVRALGIENGAYVGIPLIALVAFATVAAWKKRLVRIGAVSTVIILLISCGEVLKVNGRKTGLHSPYKLLTHVKYVENILPIRFMYFVWMGVALLAAVGIDVILRWHRKGSHASSRTSSVRVGVAALVIAAITITLWPATSIPMVPTAVPPWLLTSQASREIPATSTVLYYPYPLPISNHSMINQAVGNFHYKIIGGEAIVGDANGVSVGIVPLSPLALPTVFIRAYTGILTGPIAPFTWTLPPMPALNAQTIHDFRSFINVNHVSTILMEQTGTPQSNLVLRYLNAAFGPPQSKDGGQLLVWTRQMMIYGSLCPSSPLCPYVK